VTAPAKSGAVAPKTEARVMRAAMAALEGDQHGRSLFARLPGERRASAKAVGQAKARLTEAVAHRVPSSADAARQSVRRRTDERCRAA
jgi:hypothetical protein